jgi:hypothetical protein
MRSCSMPRSRTWGNRSEPRRVHRLPISLQDEARNGSEADQSPWVEGRPFFMHPLRMDNSDIPPVSRPERSVTAGLEVGRFRAICLTVFGVFAAMTLLAVVLFLSLAAPLPG